MALEANGKKLFLSKGEFFFKRKVATGSASGLLFFGQVTSVQLRPKGETITERSAVQTSAGIVAQDKVTTDDELAITLKEIDAEKVALAVMGDVTGYTQAATPVANEVFVDVRQGTYIKTAKRKIGSVVVTGPGASPTYTAGTDYVVEDADAGLIYIVPGGAIADAADLEVDYTPTAISTALNRVRGAVSAFIEGECLLIGNPIRGKKFELRGWRLSLQTQAVLDLISGDNKYGELQLVGTFLSDATVHADSPYYDILEVSEVA